MKNLIILVLTFVVLSVSSCTNAQETKDNIPEGVTKIKIIEHQNGAGYTFIKGAINDGSEVWIAVKEMPVEKGETYYYKDAMEMKDFKSKSLNKTFDSILFIGKLSKNADGSDAPGSSMPEMMIPGHSKPKVTTESKISVTPLKDGKTIEVIAKEKDELNGKVVKFRGVVTKFNGEIMDRNWLHIQDGTSYGKTFDITVTSDQSAKVGDEIVVEGTLMLNKDFGAGYVYNMIVENAKLINEKKK